MTIDRLSPAASPMLRAPVVRRAEAGDSAITPGPPDAKATAIPSGRDRASGATEPGYAIGSLMAEAGERLDQFDRVLQSLRANLPADTYGGTPAVPTGVMVDRIA